MNTIIKLRCIDQVLTFESTPLIASGGLDEDRIVVSFCSKWDGTTKTAVFWRTEDEPYHVLLDDEDGCLIPPEVLADEGAFYFALFGVYADGKRRTSQGVRYNVAKGAITAGSKPPDPTPEFWDRVLAKCQEMVEIAATTRQAETAFEQSMTNRQTQYEQALTQNVAATQARHEQLVEARQTAFEEEVRTANTAGNVLVARNGEHLPHEIYLAHLNKKAVLGVWSDGTTLPLSSMVVDSDGNCTSVTFSNGVASATVKGTLFWSNTGGMAFGDTAYTKLFSREKTPGDYTVQLLFCLYGTSTEAAGSSDDRDEGLYLLPLNDSTNPGITTDETGRYNKYKVRLSVTSGVQLIYGSNVNGDYSGVLAGYRSSGSDDTLPRSLTVGTVYWAKVAKIGDTLRVKVWENFTSEPDWQCSYSNANIDGHDGLYNWGFEMHFTNKGGDAERAWVSDVEFRDVDGNPFWEGAFASVERTVGLFSTGSTDAWGSITLKSFAATNHSHSAGDISGGRFIGPVYTSEYYQMPDTYLIRNSKLATAEETPTVNGQICWLCE